MFRLDLMSRKPIYEQLVEQTEKLLLAGIIKPNDKMPSVRSLSTELSVNPNTIQRAYNTLCDRGIIYSVAGKGCFVSDNAESIKAHAANEKLDELGRIVDELKRAGVSRERVISVIDNTFGENKA